MPDRVADVWGARTPHGRDTPWPARVDLSLDDGLDESDVDNWVQSACALCSNGYACDIAVKDGRMVGVRGRAADRVETDLDTAMDRIVGRSKALLGEVGCDRQGRAGHPAHGRQHPVVHGALFLFGHNMAETQTVLWSRVLDRLAGPDRPAR